VVTLRGPRGRLFRKYVVVFVVLVSGALLTSGLVELYFSYQDQRNALADFHREKAAVSASTIEQFIEGIVQRVRGVTRTPRAATSTGVEQRRMDYLTLLKNTPAITEVSYLDSGGKEQLRISRLALDVIGSNADFSKEPKFREPQAQSIFFSPVYFRNDSEPYLTISAAEKGTDGGVVVAEVNLKFIWDVVSRIKVGTAGRAYAVDSTGALVAHPDNSLVLKKTDLSTLPQVRRALGESPGRAGQTQREVTIERDSQGERVLTTYMPIKLLDWRVFVEQPFGEAFAPLFFSILRTGLLVLIGIVLAVLASFFLARRMVTPIQALQASAARIGAGALDESIDLQTGDELQELGEEFNRMTAQLRESYATLEQRVEERTAELAAVNSELETFSYSVSHDLRAPLRGIDGFSQALLEDYADKVDAEGQNYLHRIRAASQRMGQLIDDLLDLSRVTRTDMHREAVDLSSIAQAIATELRESDSERDVEFVIEEGAVVTGDTPLLRAVMENLLGNAWKYTGKHQRAKIEFGITRNDGNLAYFVRDDGAGFDMAYAANLFGVFQRLHGSSEFEGTGIGLATVQRIIHRHGGRIWAEGAVEQGATFYFTLS